MRSKVRVSLVPFLLFSAVPFSVALAEPSPVQVVVGQVALRLPPNRQPFLENGVTMVPVSSVLTAAGARVTGDGQRLTAQTLCHSVNLESGANDLKADGLTHRLPVPARKVDGELYAPLRPVAEALGIAVEWDAEKSTAVVSPKPGEQSGRHQARVTIKLRQDGTLTLPAALQESQKSMRVTAGSYSYVIDPVGPGQGYVWSYLPAGSRRPQTLTVTYNGTSFRATPATRDISATVEETSLLYQWAFEQAARRQLDKASGPLLEQELTAISSLTLPPRLQSVSDLCRFPKLTRLVLEEGTAYSADLVLSAVAKTPELRTLTLTGPSDLPTDATAVATDRLPLRVETPHGIFLGDKGMEMSTLTRYALNFESITLPELERDTGLKPTGRKAVIVLYGDRKHWDTVTANSPFWGFYAAQEDRIHMAHWKSPEVVNSLLLTHEMFHWLAWEEGKVNLPTWLNEGLAHNLSWRIEQWADSWLNPFVRREWLRVSSNPQQPIPALAGHTAQDEYTITAVAQLLQTRGRDALVPFFELTRDGSEFSAAFRQAFGVTPAEFEAEYDQQVQLLRKGR